MGAHPSVPVFRSFLGSRRLSPPTVFARVRIVAGEKVDSVRGESLVRAGKGSFPDYFRGYQVSQVRKLMSESDPLRSRSIHQK
jgi:hypothetical protein